MPSSTRVQLDFEYYQAPATFETSPSSGPTSGGTNITISGQLYRAKTRLFANDGVCDEPFAQLDGLHRLLQCCTNCVRFVVRHVAQMPL